MAELLIVLTLGDVSKIGVCKGVPTADAPVIIALVASYRARVMNPLEANALITDETTINNGVCVGRRTIAEKHQDR